MHDELAPAPATRDDGRRRPPSQPISTHLADSGSHAAIRSSVHQMYRH